MQRVKTWQLFALLIIMVFVSATFLRLNNIGMIERRSAVISADREGDNAKTQTRLYDLQRYVSAHMNTDLGKGVGLEATYNHDYSVLLAKFADDSNSNGNIYKKAQDICAPQFSVYSSAYLSCTLNELDKYPASTDLVDSVYLPTSAYIYSFASPVWSFDFAGVSVLLCVVILIMIIARFIGVIILKMLLKYRYANI
jgi:hypothetical protein